LSLKIPCPRCGERAFQEFVFGGEEHEPMTADPSEDFRRVYLRENVAGPQRERWFHAAGCRRWCTITRDTRTNRIG
jgi:sarcosine oxidase subunit delta